MTLIRSLQWSRMLKSSHRTLLPRGTQLVRTRHKGVVVSYSAGVSLIITLEDGVTHCNAHLVQCGGTPYVPTSGDVVRVDNVNGDLVVDGKYIL